MNRENLLKAAPVIKGVISEHH